MHPLEQNTLHSRESTCTFCKPSINFHQSTNGSSSSSFKKRHALLRSHQCYDIYKVPDECQCIYLCTYTPSMCFSQLVDFFSLLHLIRAFLHRLCACALFHFELPRRLFLHTRPLLFCTCPPRPLFLHHLHCLLFMHFSSFPGFILRIHVE